MSENAPQPPGRLSSSAVDELSTNPSIGREPRSATLHVNLDALAHNYRLLRERAKPAECAAVVKANAYGLGLDRVARRLLREGCHRFFVATLSEAHELRMVAPSAAIYVLEGALSTTVSALVKIGARPVLNSLEQIKRWAGNGPALVHIDTGMNRLGLSADEIGELANHGDLLSALEVECVITHFACADEPAHPLLAKQLDRFHKLRRLWPNVQTSIGNSGATFFDAAHRGDMVRPGIALYGGNPFRDRPNPLEVVATLTAPILQLRDVGPGESVGYGSTYVATSSTRIAVVGVGYADGYRRSLSNNGTASLHGQRIPIVGRVSMDLITVDVSALPHRKVNVGDRVELFGQIVSIDEVAAAAGTISYEILTGMGRRLAREYVEAE